MKIQEFNSINQVIQFMLDHVIECSPENNCGKCDTAKEAVKFLVTRNPLLTGVPLTEDEYYQNVKNMSLNDLTSYTAIDTEEERKSLLDGFKTIMAALDADEEHTVLLSVDSFDTDRPYIYNFPGFNEALEKSTEIWEDKYWAATPGSNSIYRYEYDGSIICVWAGSNWDNPQFYAKQRSFLK